MRFIGPITAGKVTTVATLGIIIALYSTSGGKMFSSGPLSSQQRGTETIGGVHSHAELAGNCSACHAPAWSRDTMATRCLACHADVHEQLDAKVTLHGAIPNSDDCRRCHSEHNGPRAPLTNLASFDHAWTAFPLTGKHQSTECKACHTTPGYKGTAHTCISCHADTHHKGSMGTSCQKCHSTNDWKGARFDHNLTAFKLTGKHETAQCQACHKENVAFKDTPHTCVSCHADTHHKGSFGQNCQGCHSTTTFKGATFTHRFPIQHGSRRRNNNTCSTCHNDATNYKSYTCYNCHEHSPSKMERIHARRNIVNFSACADCHFRKGGKKRREASLDDLDAIQRWLGTQTASACPITGPLEMRCPHGATAAP